MSIKAKYLQLFRMNYLQLTITVTDTLKKEILIAQLAELGFEGFEDQDEALIAFIPENDMDQPAVDALLTEKGLPFSARIIEQQNWNAAWESSFEPVVVGEFCAIRAHFHEPVAGVKHDIIITPKMSFGTGHHATTAMMVEHLSTLDLKDKTLVDYGTGTGILAILAEMEGAKDILAIDNDIWSIDNAAENIQRNNCSSITLQQGDTIPAGKTFDIVLANINKHILLEHRDAIVDAAQPGGFIVLSGLLKEDRNDILAAFEAENTRMAVATEKDQWLSILLTKK